MLTWIRNILHSASGADDWQRAWEARLEALESIFGRCDGTVYHSPPPTHLEGYADVLRFRNWIDGIAYVTCDLIGNPRQVPNQLGNYELMICTREDTAWAPAVLSSLARYTHDAAVHPLDTMDLAHAVPRGSTIEALLFAPPDIENLRFEVMGKPASVMLSIGITHDEFMACKSNSSKVVLRVLKERGIFPYTDLSRDSVS